MLNSRKISDLKPLAQGKCLQLVQACKDADINLKVIQTLRDAEYQHYLYEQGRTKPGSIVTYCDGYKKPSNHQSGMAWDAVPLDEHLAIIWSDDALYLRMAEIAKHLGIRAGYYWKRKDSPHFEI